MQDRPARLRAAHEPELLRVSGLLEVAGDVVPLAVQGIDPVVHPPMRLQRRPLGARSSQLVLIVRGADAMA